MVRWRSDGGEMAVDGGEMAVRWRSDGGQKGYKPNGSKDRAYVL